MINNNKKSGLSGGEKWLVSLIVLVLIMAGVFLKREYIAEQYQGYILSQEKQTFFNEQTITLSKEKIFPQWLSNYDENCTTNNSLCYATIMDYESDYSWQKNIALCTLEALTDAMLFTQVNAQGLDKTHSFINDKGEEESEFSQVSKLTTDNKYDELTIQSLVKHYGIMKTVNNQDSFGSNSSQVTKISFPNALSLFDFKSYAQLTKLLEEQDDTFESDIQFAENISTEQLTQLFTYLSKQGLMMKKFSIIAEGDNSEKYYACQLNISAQRNN